MHTSNSARVTLVLLFVTIFVMVSMGLDTMLSRADAVSDRDSLTFGPSVQVSEPTRNMGLRGYDVSATRLLPHGHLGVRLVNGAVYDMAPCRAEDSRRCYWDAESRGNRVGTSFFRLHGVRWWLL